ncbi:16S rRNA (uracil(1498)-N(3))-methyltransferase [Natronospira sp.]|uniref:16S rRNA (uracil(1498)-N(3))-methyltransferase n=1 Tax=Natronospira sp. TaxID=2024970 RepID=UPI003872C398
MRIPRVLLDAQLAVGQELSLTRDTAHHLRRVLRLKDGHPVQVFDGRGHEHEGELLGEDRVLIGESIEREVESPLALTLVQGISRGNRMDYSLQKAVELGVSAIHPIFCERSVVRLDEKRLAKRMAHWQGVIVSACEQCGRNRLPELGTPSTLMDSPPNPDGLGLFLDPNGSETLSSLERHDSMTLVVGPEGGLSDLELTVLREAGYRGIRMGPRILRTETAGVAALAALQALHGDF